MPRTALEREAQLSGPVGVAAALLLVGGGVGDDGVQPASTTAEAAAVPMAAEPVRKVRRESEDTARPYVA
ncbi:hypothetical protein AX769_15000 [Frondihabitans sp. PAMC 28766]|nr:hypothetical protein AX769_15000 [Frondihabitans sp. PAMC 28766]